MSLSTITVFLKPRPTHEQYGTEWLPRGSSYGPFHPDYSPPSDATEEHEITLPNQIIDQWTEFHREILPLLVVPQIDDSADPRELYAAWCHLSVVGRASNLVVYLLIRARKLQLDLGLGFYQRSLLMLCEKLIVVDIFSLEAPAIELKISLNIILTLRAYLMSAYDYGVELKRRCSTWDRLCVRSSFGLQRSLFNIADKNPLPATTISPSSFSEASDWDRIPEDPPHYRSSAHVSHCRNRPHTTASAAIYPSPAYSACLAIDEEDEFLPRDVGEREAGDDAGVQRRKRGTRIVGEGEPLEGEMGWGRAQWRPFAEETQSWRWERRLPHLFHTPSGNA
ncbi:hypothetical protein GGX14DRAFT_397326 [Mycena pura]|uniref:Uncharacterized protein n=1 Tax=Mycena pura TaxID=153505 RepID=A0AAD6VCK8_9AGAR|nr:hypothetical protein GGX14DRAFT_397326 [Mycena pura]